MHRTPTHSTAAAPLQARTTQARPTALPALILSLIFALALMLAATPAAQGQNKDQAPVKVYILAGQSNMVGIGTVQTSGQRWGNEMIDPVLSIYDTPPSPDTDYDSLEPTQTMPLDSFGGVKPTPYPPGGGTYVVRGTVKVPEAGTYEFRPGYGNSTHNIMTVDGKVAHRKQPGQKHAESTGITLQADQPVPFKIVYLTNENLRGLGWTARIDFPGTLHTAVKEQGKYPFLLDDQGNWKVWDDAWYHGVVTATGNQWLTVGCGAGNGKIGPELGFGHVMAQHHDEPVLIIKASQGNRSLGWDFLPPGSERFEVDGMIYAGYKDSPARWEKGTEPEPINWYAGKQYDDCFNEAKSALKNFDSTFPHWAGRDYEIAGFVWWQGHKDSGSSVYQQRYEQNLVQLINVLRDEFNAPNAPFIVGTIGFHGWDMPEQYLPIANAQLAVSDDNKYPQFKNNVKTVETRDFWAPAAQSPKNQDFHYNQNGETYLKVGLEFGKGMVELLEQQEQQ